MVEQAVVFERGAALALRLGMFGQKAFREIGDCRRFLSGALVCRGIPSAFRAALVNLEKPWRASRGGWAR
jgi:hypothetical protein